jgi:hypothetical protein
VAKSLAQAIQNEQCFNPPSIDHYKAIYTLVNLFQAKAEAIQNHKLGSISTNTYSNNRTPVPPLPLPKDIEDNTRLRVIN